MIDRFTAFTARPWVWAMAFIVLVSGVSLAWLEYQAVSQWQRSATLLAQRRAEAAVDLLVTAVTRDMRGVQASMLSELRFDVPSPDPLLDLNSVGSAFARYPYPEALFASQGTPIASVTFYGRADRRPPWILRTDGPTRFPVVVARHDGVGRMLLERIRRDAAHGRRFATFDMTLQGVRYQVIALLSYVPHADTVGENLAAVVGFIVNLDWMRRQYFPDLVAQVTRINAADPGLHLAVIDAQGAAVVGTAGGGDAPSSSRTFPLLFFDPSLIALDPPPDLGQEVWTARASVVGDPTLAAARLGARRTLIMSAVGALVLAVGFALAVRAARANARLSTMRSNFVSAVTHELKTPIATIRAINETLAAGRSTDPRMAREYAQLAVNEAKRLARLIDNLLAYARITDVTVAYAFEPVAVETIAQQSLKDFQSQLSTAGFSIEVDIPHELPLVRADRPSIVLALGNLLDNAIRYSNDTRRLRIAAHASNGSVVLDVTDAGVGIPDDEIEHVTRKFFRGNGASSGGSGLGLSIAERIVSDHAGSLSIHSRVGVGTTVSIRLPATTVDDEETHPDR